LGVHICPSIYQEPYFNCVAAGRRIVQQGSALLVGSIHR